MEDPIAQRTVSTPDISGVAFEREFKALRAVAEAAEAFRRSPIGSGREEIMERKERLQALDDAIAAWKKAGAK